MGDGRAESVGDMRRIPKKLAFITYGYGTAS